MLEYLRNSSNILKSKNYILGKELESLKHRNQKLLDQNKSLFESLNSQRQQYFSLKNSNVRLIEGIKKQKESNTSLVKKLNSTKLEHLSELKHLKEEHQKQETSLRIEIAKLRKELRDSKSKMKAPSILVTPRPTTADSSTKAINSFRFTFSETKGDWEPCVTSAQNDMLPRNLSMISIDSITSTTVLPEKSVRHGRINVLPPVNNMKNESSSSLPPSKHWRSYHLSRKNTFSYKPGVNYLKNNKEKSQSPVLRHSQSSLALALESLNSQVHPNISRDGRSIPSEAGSKSSLSKALESSRAMNYQKG